MLLSWQTGSISGGNLFSLDIISNRAHKTAGNNIVAIGNKESCPWEHYSFKYKTLSPLALVRFIQLIIIVSSCFLKLRMKVTYCISICICTLITYLEISILLNDCCNFLFVSFLRIWHCINESASSVDALCILIS